MRLLQIDTTTGTVADVATIDDTYVVTAIAFDPTSAGSKSNFSCQAREYRTFLCVGCAFLAFDRGPM